MPDNNKVSARDIQANLSGVDYPASKQDLVSHAEDQGASQEVVNKIKQMPDKNYNSPVDLMKEFGKEK